LSGHYDAKDILISMVFDFKLLATINLVVQALLVITVLVAAYLARNRQLIKHCTVMRVVTAVQLLSIFLIMLPLMIGYLKHPRQEAFQTEMLVHHSLGVLIILLWVYVNLTVAGRVRVIGQLAIYMRAAFVMWVLSFPLGLYLYLQLYVLQ